MKITIAELKKQLRVLNQKLKVCDSVEEVQKTLATITSLLATINKTLEEVTVTTQQDKPPISVKEFLKLLKQKQLEKQTLSNLEFVGKLETERKEQLLELTKTIEEGKLLYNRFIYGTEFEVESDTTGTGT